MDLEMALGAFCEESPAPPGFAKRILGMASCGQSLGFGETQAACVEMRFMALKAEKRLVLFEHIISHGPMGIVTNGAIFYNRCMFENGAELFFCNGAVISQYSSPSFKMRLDYTSY